MMYSVLKYFNPFAYLRKIISIYWSLNYDIEQWRRSELDKFAKSGFDFKSGEKHLSDLLNRLGKKHLSENDGMASVHWHLFSCIALQRKVSRILEIGTYDGETALVLSKLFPDAEITTFDLPDNDPIMTSSYGRDDPEAFQAHKQIRAKNLEGANIKFIDRNSIFILDEAVGKYDLIWVDGGHLYPEVAWDMSNAYHLCAPKGIIMCDDIIPHPKGFKNSLVGPEGYQVLEYLAARIVEKPIYFLKRLSPKWSANPKSRKFVAVLEKR